jgi:hypothetical protein
VPAPARPLLPRALRLAFLALDLAALSLAVWSVAGAQRPPAPPAVLPLAAWAEPVRLAPGQAWAAVEEAGRQQERLEGLGLEIGELIEAVMSLRRDTDLLAEDAQLAHERLEALEARPGRPGPVRGSGGLSPRPKAGP